MTALPPRFAACLVALALAASPRAQVISLPVTFNDPAVNYELTDFGGASSSLVADPTDPANTVVRTVRTAEAACFAGTTVAEVSGLSERIPFAPGQTTMSVRVWSPQAGIRVLFKVEQVGVPTVNVETLARTTVSGAWETLVFDFARPMPNMNPISFGALYNKASIFFDFSCDVNPAPPAPPERTYYWDDLTFGGVAPPPPPPPASAVSLPVTFEDPAVNYELTDFGGNASERVVDPTDATNTVVRSIRTVGAAFFSGTTVANATGFTTRIPFAPGQTTMRVRVWSPQANIPVRFKVEKFNDPTVSVEAEVRTSAAGEWETLIYDFVADQVPNTAPINFASEYTKASIFFNFGQEGATSATTYYWDDVAFGGAVSADTDVPGAASAPTVSPNPATARSAVAFSLAEAGAVRVDVLDRLGRLVSTLADGSLAAGPTALSLPPGLAPGLYVVRVRTGADVATTRFTVVR